jgi:regulatory protein
MSRVTALHPERRDRVRVELDGAPWRTLPAGAIVSAGLLVGTELDRERARELARALRRVNALAAATAALARRDRSAAGLDAYLRERGVGATERTQAVEALTRFGYVDDSRFTGDRVAYLLRRGFGDEGIRFDLAGQGLDSERIEAAIAAIEPEADRARAIVQELDASPKTARRLAAKGFSLESIESAVGLLEP